MPDVPAPSLFRRRPQTCPPTRGRPARWRPAWRWTGALTLAWAGMVPAAAQGLPAEVRAALQRAGVPEDALTVVVQEVSSPLPRLQWREQAAVNPASLTKLVTTAAALEQLGPAWTWTTPVWLDGPLRDGVLDGSVYIRGSGDPKLVLERVWLLLHRVQQAGVREIRGDIVLDGSAFAVPPASAADFDGESLRPYNVQPAALLLNYRSVLHSFVPDRAAGVARVVTMPLPAGSQVDGSVPLADGPCGDWRAALRASFGPGRTRFAGSYPVACGERTWPVADPQPESFDARLVQALWAGLGGRLLGSVREGVAPTGRPPTFEVNSPALAELVRDINKFSNNVMAQQLFLTLALQQAPDRAATPEAARETLTRWLIERTGPVGTDEPVIDNGSGLSRLTRLSAARLALLLRLAWSGPVMSELMSSLPILGSDGTLRRTVAGQGSAHLKTGSLRDVQGLAGYVLSEGGRRYVLVAIVNHPRAGQARPALEALVRWAMRDAPPG